MTAYRFVDVEKGNHTIVRLCAVLGVSRSGFYDWKAREPSKRCIRDRKLVTHIRAAHTRSRGTYGRPRLHAELVDQGVQVGQRRVGRLMREEGLAGIPRKRFRVTTTTDSSRKVVDNVLDRQFTRQRPNQTWVTDITYVQVGSQWLYLAVILDLFSRKVVGWAAAPHLRTDLCLQALKSAVAIRRPEAGLVHHSDRGCQNTSHEYQAELRNHGIVPSMSRKDNCWDNALAESFFGTLKAELVHRRAFRSFAEAHDELSNYIHAFYNAERRHSTIGRVSPNAFEKHALQTKSGSAT
ncbi:MAG: putative transposase [Kiritimatiellia bacterium]